MKSRFSRKNRKPIRDEEREKLLKGLTLREGETRAPGEKQGLPKSRGVNVRDRARRNNKKKKSSKRTFLPYEEISRVSMNMPNCENKKKRRQFNLP